MPSPEEHPSGDAIRQQAFAACELRILVADDDEGCLESVRSVLTLDGHRIFTATRGWEAVELTRRLKEEARAGRGVLDVSILDFNMPDLTGVETFRHIVLELPSVQGIVISGEASQVLEQLVIQAGIRALLKKPLDLHRIRSLIRSLMLDISDRGAGNAPKVN